MSNSLDPDQARRYVGADLGPNCLQMLSTDDTSRERVNIIRHVVGALQKTNSGGVSKYPEHIIS